MYDPRYLDERIETPSLPSYPWNFSNEHAAAMARPQSSELSGEELPVVDKIYSDNPKDPNGEALATHYHLWEEGFYCLMMECYDSEHKAYERLKDLRGPVIPRLMMAVQFLPQDERAIQPPALLVLEYIPCYTCDTERSALRGPLGRETEMANDGSGTSRNRPSCRHS